MPDTPQLDHVVPDRVNEYIGRLVDAPLAGVFVFTHTANARIFQQGCSGIQDALSDLPRGLGIVLGDVIVRLFEVCQGQSGPA